MERFQLQCEWIPLILVLFKCSLIIYRKTNKYIIINNNSSKQQMAHSKKKKERREEKRKGNYRYKVMIAKVKSPSQH